MLFQALCRASHGILREETAEGASLRAKHMGLGDRCASFCTTCPQIMECQGSQEPQR